jgi:hypothetical protein
MKKRRSATLQAALFLCRQNLANQHILVQIKNSPTKEAIRENPTETTGENAKTTPKG